MSDKAMQTGTLPGWAALTVWTVVNTVNLLQSVGFLSRVWTKNRTINQRIGYAIAGLAVPAMAALTSYARIGAGWLYLAGPAMFLVFVVFMIGIDYVWKIEFRSPLRASIAVPYLVLFFGSIILMGLPMFSLNRTLWLVTVITSLALVGSMGLAMRKDVG